MTAYGATHQRRPSAALRARLWARWLAGAAGSFWLARFGSQVAQGVHLLGYPRTLQAGEQWYGDAAVTGPDMADEAVGTAEHQHADEGTP